MESNQVLLQDQDAIDRRLNNLFDHHFNNEYWNRTGKRYDDDVEDDSHFNHNREGDHNSPLYQFNDLEQIQDDSEYTESISQDNIDVEDNVDVEDLGNDDDIREGEHEMSGEKKEPGQLKKEKKKSTM